MRKIRIELDVTTLVRAQQGDNLACKKLVLRYQHAVFGLLSRLLTPARRQLFVEEVAQETFLRVFRNLGRFSPHDSMPLSSWILTIASHLAIDELRRRRPEQMTAEAYSSLELVSGASVDRASHRGDIVKAVHEALDELSPGLRTAFVLREYHGLPYHEIAQTLRIKLGCVRSRLFRSRTVLRSALADLRE